MDKKRHEKLPILIGQEEWKGLAAALKLSAREQAIAEQLLAGHRESDVAEFLGISVHTVRTYPRRLYLKVDVHSRTEFVVAIVALYLEHKSILIAPDTP